jgi:hypothetical protein
MKKKRAAYLAEDGQPVSMSIVVVNRGMIKEQNTHPLLIRNDSLYAHLRNTPAVAGGVETSLHS